MPTYIMLTALTSEGATPFTPIRIASRPSPTRSPGSAARWSPSTRSSGGPTFVTIVDAPDNETVAHFSVDLGPPGAAARIQTLPAISLDVLMAKLKGPDQLGR